MKRAFTYLSFVLWAVAGCRSDNADVGPKNGQGGSMARFAIAGNSLYIVDNQSLITYDISNPGEPLKKGSQTLDFGIETIFPYGTNLFIGASDGMYIFDNTDRSDPKLISKFQHIQSCDPVVVQDHYAYVTLRGGNECRLGNSLSSLDVIDISVLTAPKLVRTQSLDSPYGLGVSGERLFVCEGDNGLKIFELTDPKVPVLSATYKDIHAYDVIIRNSGSLILTGKKGLFQFGFGETADELELLSQIPVQ